MTSNYYQTPSQYNDQSLNESLQSVLDIMKPKAELDNVGIYRPYKENVSIKADEVAFITFLT